MREMIASLPDFVVRSPKSARAVHPPLPQHHTNTRVKDCFPFGGHIQTTTQGDHYTVNDRSSYRVLVSVQFHRRKHHAKARRDAAGPLFRLLNSKPPCMRTPCVI